VVAVSLVCILVFAAMVIFNDISKLNLFTKVKP
jgi:regulator of sigma E protease